MKSFSCGNTSKGGGTRLLSVYSSDAIHHAVVASLAWYVRMHPLDLQEKFDPFIV